MREREITTRGGGGCEYNRRNDRDCEVVSSDECDAEVM